MKVLDNSGNGYVSWSVDAEQWVLSSGLRPAVVSMSLGVIGVGVQVQGILIDAAVGWGQSWLFEKPAVSGFLDKKDCSLRLSAVFIIRATYY